VASRRRVEVDGGLRGRRLVNEREKEDLSYA